MMKQWLLILLLLFSVTAASLPAAEYRHPEVEALLLSDESPDGVVFELLSWDSNTWAWAAPMLKDFRARLQVKFPGLDVVVVSHGSEQFQLQKNLVSDQPEAIATLQSLSGEGMNIHVCGVHYAWNNVSEDSYLDFIDVAPSGPARINDYKNLGYKKILLRKPD